MKKELDWKNILFLTISPLLGILGTAVYTIFNGLNAWELLTFFAFVWATGFSITAGYHRYFSHKSYECHFLVKLFFLVFGAAALQNSVRHWARDHRNHHKYEDQDPDPYNIKKGFWHAHIAWIFYKGDPNLGYSNIPDLEKDRLVAWQDRWYLPLGIIAGFGIPVAIGLLIGRPLGGLLWGGFLRVVLVHHMTFCVNSFAHMWGTQPYSTANTSRDSWVVALMTNGEGYHNFHHRFPADYRNAVRWYQWDPTKWMIKVFFWTGLAKNLCRTDAPLILKAAMEGDMASVHSRFRGISEEHKDLIRSQLEAARRALEHTIQEWGETKAKYRRFEASAHFQAEHLRLQWNQTLSDCERRYKMAKSHWKSLIQDFRTLPLTVVLSQAKI